MKKNLLTKTLLLSALFSAVVLAGCNQNVEPSAVEEITVTSVVPATKAENAEPVPSKEVFKETVLKKLGKELSGLSSAIVPTIDTGSKSREAVTMDELQNSFKEFTKAFEMKLSEEDGSGYIRGSWNGPVGELDYGEDVKGLSTRIDAMRVSVDASFNTTADGKTTGKANGSARYAASSKLDLTKESSSIKSGKANVLYYLNVNNVNASVSADKMATIMSVAGSNPDYDAVVEALNTLSGAINFYSGIDTALYFEVEDEKASKLYNGVIKATVSAAINYNLSKEALADTAEKVLAIVEKYENDDDYEVTAEDLAAFNDLVSLRIDLSVYDTEGKKLFSLVDATKLDEAYTEIDSLVSGESN